MSLQRRSIILAVAFAAFTAIPGSFVFAAWMSGSLPFHSPVPIALVGTLSTLTWWLGKAKLVLWLAAVRSSSTA